MEDHEIKREAGEVIISSLAVPIATAAVDSAHDADTPTLRVRVGATGAIYDLAAQGKLDEILLLLAKEKDLTTKWWKKELQLRRFHDHGWLDNFIKSHRGRGIEKKLEAETARVQQEKDAVEVALAEIHKKISDVDPRLAEPIQSPTTQAGAAQLPLSRLRGTRPSKPEVAARNQVIAAHYLRSDEKICTELDDAFPYDEENDRPAPQLPTRWADEGAKTFCLARVKFPNRVHRLISGVRRLCRLP